MPRHLSKFLFAASTLCPLGCAHKDVEAKVLHQAAFDLQCDQTQMQLQKISDDHAFMGVKNATYGVRGCDRQATYKTSCGLGNCQVMGDAQSPMTRQGQ